MTSPKSRLRVAEVDAGRPGVVRLEVAGELDMVTAGTLRAALDGQFGPGVRILLDLAGLIFCDSTGLGAIIKLHRLAGDQGGTLALCAPTNRMMDVLHISGVDQVITVYPTIAAAVKALDAN